MKSPFTRTSKPFFKRQGIKSPRLKAHGGGGICALHLRAGDALYQKRHQEAVVKDNIYHRAFAYPLAIELIDQELKSGSVVIVCSDDLSLLESLKKELPSLLNLSKDQAGRFFISADLGESFTHPAHKALYENALLSYADRLYCTKNSGYSTLALLTGKMKDECVVYECLGAREQYEILAKYTGKLKGAHAYQNVFACYQAFRLSRELKMGFEVAKSWLLRALEFDPDNDTYRILMLELLFERCDFKGIEALLEEILKTRKDAFLQSFFSRSPTFNFSFIFNYFLKNYQKGGYTAFVAANIALNLGFDALFEKYLKIAENTINKGFESKFYQTPYHSGAVFRMKNHLSYRLGVVLIKNSYTFLGYLKMPFALLLTYIDFKRYPLKSRFKLDELEDFAEARRFVAEAAFYKLGANFILGMKTWHKGGLFKFIKFAQNMKKEYHKERKEYQKTL